MTAHRFSDQQERAITERGHSILVSAGAGSGKTSVLVERVQRLAMNEGIDLDRILIVTFTEAAANEMKERIAKALRGVLAEHPTDRQLIRQLHLLDRAQISTLHSFCLQVLRFAALQLPIDPGFRIADQQETMMLQFTVLDQLVAEWFTASNGAFKEFTLRYGDMFGDENLRTMILHLYAFARSQPQPHEWLTQAVADLARAVEVPIAESTVGIVFFSWCSEQLQAAQELIKEAFHLCADEALKPYRVALESDMALLDVALHDVNAKNYPKLQESLARSFVKLGRAPDADPEDKKQIQDLRSRVKKRVNRLTGTILARSDVEIQQEMAHTVPFMQTLIDLVWEFHVSYAEAKRSRSCVDFADLEHFAYQVLTTDTGQSSVIAEQIAEKYEQVLVDEYQDTSPIQDAILARIARRDHPTLFYVGDVKQSIYGFRMAEPGLFLEKYHDFQRRDGGVRIDLQDNYRSRREVVDAINYLFGQIFSPILGGITYDETARMNAAAIYPPLDQNTGVAGVDVHLIDHSSNPHAHTTQGIEEGDPDDENERIEHDADLGWQSAIELEARVAGQEILRLIENGTLVYDADSKHYRPLQWRDMVILLRSKAGRIDAILQVFRQLGIPCYGESDSGYYTSLEMKLILSLLQIVDNPRQDIPLATILRSPIGGFSTTDLAEIRLFEEHSDLFQALLVCSRHNEELGLRARSFLAKLERMRTLARMQGIVETVKFLIQDTGLKDFVMGLRDGGMRVANLDQFVRQARAYDELEQHTFSGFVQFVLEHDMRSGDAGSAGGVAEHDDVVRILTIHKSKGLEFPVVFLLNIEKSFRLNDHQLPIRFHKDLGFGPDFVDLKRKEKWKTIASVAVDALTSRQNLAEEARILYVAATRAREKLILVGAVRNLADTWTKWRSTALYEPSHIGPLRESVLLGAKQYLDWIGPAIYRSSQLGSPLFQVTLWGKEFDRELPRPRQTQKGQLDWEAIARLTPGQWPVGPEFLAESATWREKVLAQLWNNEERVVSLSAKMSVTEWKNNWIDQSDEAEGSGQLSRLTRQVHFSRPRFMTQDSTLTASEKGSLFHTAMQHFKLTSGLTEGREVIRQMQELIRSGFLPGDALLHLEPEAFVGYFQSTLGQLMITNCDRVLREIPFTLAVPAAQLAPHVAFSHKIATEHVIIQGTVDCLIALEKGMILVDYKTDHEIKSESELVNRYELQLALYKVAMERAYSRPISGAYLYFMNGHKTVEITKSMNWPNV